MDDIFEVSIACLMRRHGFIKFIIQRPSNNVEHLRSAITRDKWPVKGKYANTKFGTYNDEAGNLNKYCGNDGAIAPQLKYCCLTYL